jgi:hypothetical protein
MCGHSFSTYNKSVRIPIMHAGGQNGAHVATGEHHVSHGQPHAVTPTKGSSMSRHGLSPHASDISQKSHNHIVEHASQEEIAICHQLGPACQRPDECNTLAHEKGCHTVNVGLHNCFSSHAVTSSVEANTAKVGDTSAQGMWHPHGPDTSHYQEIDVVVQGVPVVSANETSMLPGIDIPLHLDQTTRKAAKNTSSDAAIGAYAADEQTVLGSPVDLDFQGQVSGSYQTPEYPHTKPGHPPAPRKHAPSLLPAGYGRVCDLPSENITPNILQGSVKCQVGGEAVVIDNVTTEELGGSDANQVADCAPCGTFKPHNTRCKRLSFSELLDPFTMFTPERAHTLDPPAAYMPEQANNKEHFVPFASDQGHRLDVAVAYVPKGSQGMDPDSDFTTKQAHVFNSSATLKQMHTLEPPTALLPEQKQALDPPDLAETTEAGSKREAATLGSIRQNRLAEKNSQSSLHNVNSVKKRAAGTMLCVTSCAASSGQPVMSQGCRSAQDLRAQRTTKSIHGYRSGRGNGLDELHNTSTIVGGLASPERLAASSVVECQAEPCTSGGMYHERRRTRSRARDSPVVQLCRVKRSRGKGSKECMNADAKTSPSH